MNYKIRIVNLRNYKKSENEILIKVDRTTLFGNPFFLKRESERENVIKLYEDYFYNELLTKSNIKLKILDVLEKLENNNIALGCWCYPKKCHGEIIKKYLEVQRWVF